MQLDDPRKDIIVFPANTLSGWGTVLAIGGQGGVIHLADQPIKDRCKFGHTRTYKPGENALAAKQQHKDEHRKILLRRSLLSSALPGPAYVPYMGDGDLALALLHRSAPLRGRYRP